jgi:hypothetical protein
LPSPVDEKILVKKALPRRFRTILHSASVQRKGEAESRFVREFMGQSRPIVALRQLAKNSVARAIRFDALTTWNSQPARPTPDRFRQFNFGASLRIAVINTTNFQSTATSRHGF